MSRVYLRVHSWCCPFCGSGQTHDDMHPPCSCFSLRIESMFFSNPKFILKFYSFSFPSWAAAAWECLHFICVSVGESHPSAGHWGWLCIPKRGGITICLGIFSWNRLCKYYLLLLLIMTHSWNGDKACVQWAPDASLLSPCPRWRCELQWTYLVRPYPHAGNEIPVAQKWWPVVLYCNSSLICTSEQFPPLFSFF